MKRFLSLLLFVWLANTGCRPEGCMDKKAGNYNAKAKKDNGSCQYSAQIVFWSDEKAAAHFFNEGAYTLKYFINDKQVATASTNMYWTGPPACGQPSATSVDFSMESSSQSVNLKAIDNFQQQMWSEVRTIEAGSCNAIQVK